MARALMQTRAGRPPVPRLCDDCGSRWAHPDASHCATCHRTFASIRGFDAHRATGRCVNPLKLGMKLIWQRGRGGQTIPSKANGATVWAMRRGAERTRT